MLARVATNSARSSLSWANSALRVHASVPLRARVPGSGSLARASTASAVEAAAVPEVSRAVGWWLAGCAGMVGGIVMVGGLTRLTRSGLSMVDWKPQGSRPPSTPEEWAAEFDKYKEFPEYKRSDKTMTVEDFKNIYFLEWGHRMLGRGVGLVFGLPLLGFLAAGRIPPSLRGRLLTLLGLGAAQGGIGWWMVKSGLVHDNPNREVRVSPYRLATHLAMAFTTYSLLLWTALDILAPKANPALLRGLPASTLVGVRTVRGLSLVTAKLVALTVVSGAFVAGNDAGRAYNTFPKMLPDSWLPPKEQIWEVEPAWRNIFESTALVQLDHRVLAMTSASGVAALGAAAVGNRAVWTALPPQTKKALGAVVVAVAAQVGLGISTLLNYVPVELGVAHQGGALTLLSSCLWAAHSLRFAKARGAKAVADAVSKTAAASKKKSAVAVKSVGPQ